MGEEERAHGSPQGLSCKNNIVDGIVGPTIIAKRLAIAAGIGKGQRANLIMFVWIPTTNSGSMTGLVSRHAHGWPRKKNGKTRFVDGKMQLTSNVRKPAIAANTGAERVTVLTHRENNWCLNLEQVL